MTVKAELTELEQQLISEVETLAEIIYGVVANWEHGDLAGQVRAAKEAADSAVDFIVNLHAD